MLVLAVGERSEWGKTLALVVGEAGDTPLQEKLEDLAGAIGKVGLGVAILCFVALMLTWLVKNRGQYKAHGIDILHYFLFAVTIVVVAVPEGLPLAVTIALAYSMRRMMVDNNFVRVLAACETMGGATAICSDKTGTLTENRMTVTEGWFAGKKYNDVPHAKVREKGFSLSVFFLFPV
jgi:P-type Ca2+ transporter type 2C